MSIASSQQAFLVNALGHSYNVISNPKSKLRNTSTTIKSWDKTHSEDDDNHFPRKSEHQFGKLAMVALAAGVLTLGSVDDAYAGKSGGRIGGQAFRSSAPKSAGPRTRINNSRTNIYVNPPVAPPLIGGYGYGGVPYYGGWGWSPFSFFAPGPGVAVGIGGGFDMFVLFIVLGAVGAVIRKVFGSRNEDDDDY